MCARHNLAKHDKIQWRASHRPGLRQEGWGHDVEEGCHDVDHDVAGGVRVECVAQDDCQAAGAENREVAASVGGAVRAHDGGDGEAAGRGWTGAAAGGGAVGPQCVGEVGGAI